MTTKRKRMVALLTALILLGIASIYVLSGKISTKNDAQEQALPLLSAESIVAIRYTTQTGAVDLCKLDGIWVASDYAGVSLKQKACSNIEALLKGLCATRLVTKKADETGEFGLLHPSVRVNVVYSDGGTSEILIGDTNAITQESYVQLGDMPDIYTVSGDLAGAFAGNMMAFVEWDSLPVVNEYTVKSFEIDRPEDALRFVYMEGGTPEVYTSSYDWLLCSSSGTLQAINKNLMKTMLKSALEMEYKTLEAFSVDAGQMSYYGLDAPSLTVRVVYEEDGRENTLELVFGRMEEESVFVMQKGGDKIYTVACAEFESFYTIRVEDLLPVEVCLVPISTVEKMLVSMEERTWEITLVRTQEDEKESVAYYLDGELTDGDAILTVYAWVTGLISEARAGGAPKAPPYIRIQFIRNTDSFADVTLELSPYDSNFFLAAFAGRSDQLINIRDVEALTGAINDLQ